MQKIKNYTTEYYEDPTPKAIFLICAYMIIVAIFVWIMRAINSKTISLFGTFMIIALFIIILVVLKKKLIKTAILTFSNEEFTVKLYKQDSNELISEDHFLWQNIVAYKPYFDSKLNTCITLYQNKKKKYSYIFKDNKTYEQAVKQDSVFSNFYSSISAYNKQHEQQKILPKPVFWRPMQVNTLFGV